MRCEIGDVVTPTRQVKGLRVGYPYIVSNVRRGLDGAYDWDDVFLDGNPNASFCEFDFRLHPSHGSSNG